jgi:hypothetical protein
MRRMAALTMVQATTMRPTGSAIWLLTGLAGVLSGCSIFAFLAPEKVTPAERARAIEPRCRGFNGDATTALLSPESVDSVEPSYSYVQTGNDRRANLRGARIHVKPLPGLSPEAMTRTLECHEVAVVLRGQAPLKDDPYFLPGRWVDVDVSSDTDGFIVLASVIRTEEAQVVLDHARQFAADAVPPQP